MHVKNKTLLFILLRDNDLHILHTYSSSEQETVLVHFHPVHAPVLLFYFTQTASSCRNLRPWPLIFIIHLDNFYYICARSGDCSESFYSCSVLVATVDPSWQRLVVEHDAVHGALL